MPHFFTRAERTELAQQGLAMRDGGYPIRDKHDLGNAAKDYVRTGRDPKVKAWITKRAKQLGAPDPTAENYDQIVSRHAEKAR